MYTHAYMHNIERDVIYIYIYIYTHIEREREREREREIERQAPATSPCRAILHKLFDY